MRVYKEEGLHWQFNPYGESMCCLCGQRSDLPDILFYSSYKNLNAFINQFDKYPDNKRAHLDCCIDCVQRFIANYGTYNQMFEFRKELKKLSKYYDVSKYINRFGKYLLMPKMKKVFS